MMGIEHKPTGRNKCGTRGREKEISGQVQGRRVYDIRSIKAETSFFSRDAVIIIQGDWRIPNFTKTTVKLTAFILLINV